MIKYFNIITVAVLLAAAMVVDYDVGNDYVMAVDPLVGSAIVGGLGSLFGNIFSTQSANETNVALSRENRDWQTKENQLNRDFTSSQNQMSRDWQEKLWNAQNQYNTPSAMMDRYRAAGLNPFLLGGNSPTVGAAGSPGSPSQSSPAMVGAPNAAQVQPLPFGTGVSSLVGQLIQAKGVSANVANQSAQAAKSTADAANSVYKTQGKKAAYAFLKEFSPLTADLFDPEGAPEFRMLNESVKSQELMNSYQSMRNAVFDEFGAAKEGAMVKQISALADKYVGELAKTLSDIDVNQANIRVAHKKAYELGAQAAKAFASAGLDRANASTINAVREYVVNKAENDSLISDWESELKFYETTDKRSEWIYNTPWREFMESDLGTDARKAAIFNDKRVNPVFGFLDGFTSSLNLSGAVVKPIK